MKNEINLDAILKRAKESGSYFLTATILDKEKETNNLNHYVVKSDFPIDDIIPSLDNSLKSLGIKPLGRIDVIVPEKKNNDKRLKIAIISHFHKAPEYYSPARAVKNQIKILKDHGHDVVLFVQENSNIDWDCEIRTVVPSFKREKDVVNIDAKNKFIDVLRRELTNDFDVAITHDLYIDDCITYREAIKECGVDIKWFHWARSGVGKKINFSMSNAKYVYMNIADTKMFADNIGVSYDKIRVVFNEKDPSILFGWLPETKKIADHINIYNKDIIQIYPMCTTRMDAKGINSVISVFGALKRLGQNVGLIICNANGHKAKDAIESKKALAKEYGLGDDDILFTSDLSNGKDSSLEKEVPHNVVSQLFAMSNLFIFPTVAEVCSNVLLEASMTKNLLVLNEDLPSLFDFTMGNTSYIKYPFTSLQSLHYSGRDKESIVNLAKNIIGQIKSNKADLQFRHVLKNHNKEAIYNQLINVLYE